MNAGADVPTSRTMWAKVLLVGGLTLGMIPGVAAAAAGTVPPAVELPRPEVAGIDMRSTQTAVAWDWVKSMLGSPTVVTTDSHLQPARNYGFDWTGPVAGTIDLQGIPEPLRESATVLVNGSAVALSAPGFSGVINGSVKLPAAVNRWIIQVYRVNEGVRQQVPLQTLVSPDGTFSVDLSAAAAPGQGTWALGVLDAQAGYRPSGNTWPAGGNYLNLEVVSFSTTDTTYRTGATSVAADGVFSFPTSSPGVKSFELVDTQSGDVLAEYRPASGLVRSYGPDSALPNTTFTYDQALALQSAMVMDDPVTAATLAQGLMRIQSASGPNAGGFTASAPQLNPGGGQQQFFTGNHAVALYALISYLRYAHHDPTLEPLVRDAVTAGLTWLEGRRRDTGPRAGLYTAGWGASTGNLDWAAVEHNLDVWQTLRLAAQVLPCSQCQVRAAELRDALVSVMWNEQNGRFDQGARADGRDTVDPLDGNSWGAIFLTAIGDSDRAGLALTNMSAFVVTHGEAAGYLAYRAQPMRPTPVPSVWVEGTAGVALAQARSGNAAGQQSTLDALLPLQGTDGSFPMATAVDANASLVTAKSVAATSWFILASLATGPDALWN